LRAGPPATGCALAQSPPASARTLRLQVGLDPKQFLLTPSGGRQKGAQGGVQIAGLENAEQAGLVQRGIVAVARAVAFASKVVLLDEPTAALGVRESAQVLELVRSLPERGISVILISHNMEQVLEVCDRIVVLRLGRKVADRPIAGLTGPMVVGYITGAERSEA